MRRAIVSLLFSIMLANASPGFSSPVVLTDGLVSGTPGHGLSITLVGNDFSYSGFGGDWSPVTPGLCDAFSCRLGMTNTFRHVITAADQFVFGATGTYQGASFSVPWPPGSSALYLEFSGTYTVPTVATEGPFSSSKWTVTTPFTFNGYIDPIELDRIDLIGSGVLNLTATNQGFLPGTDAYFASLMQFDFQSPATLPTVPEPASVALLATGLGALGLLRRRMA